MERASASAVIAAVVLVLAGCADGPDLPPEPVLGPPEPSEITFQTVDAGTGALLADDQIRVRWLVRSPITLDASESALVPAAAPVTITQTLAQEELVLEVRLEAESYYTLDTVLVVSRGESAGPLTLRMSRRLDRMAGGRAPGRAAGGGGAAPADRPAAGGGATGAPAAEPAPDAGVDRTPLNQGNRAFQNGDWAAATLAYERMSPPEDRSSPYGLDYRDALVRKGVAHANMREWAGALDALETAVTFDDPGYNAYLRLGQAQCEVGRTNQGLETLNQVQRVQADANPRERTTILALVQYYRGLCSYGEFQRATETIDRVRTGGEATVLLNDFIERGSSLQPIPAAVREAMAEAERVIQRIQQQMRGGQ